jgi:hypothetical protein
MSLDEIKTAITTAAMALAGGRQYVEDISLLVRRLGNIGPSIDFMLGPPPKAPAKVFVLTIDSRLGHEVTVHTTRDGAVNEMYRFVKENWDEVYMGEPIPDDSTPENKNNAIAAYFEREMEIGETFKRLDECEVIETA